MLSLLLAATFFLGLHFGVAGTALRPQLIERFGKRIYHAAFGSLSLLGLAWLFHAYRAAPYVETWGLLPGVKPLAALMMLAAFLLGVPSLLALRQDIRPEEAEPARGWQRVTRHPVLTALALWSTSHLLANGDLAALILFGSLLALTLIGGRSVVAKRRDTLSEHWASYAAATSAIPFQAIVQGRNRFVWQEIRVWHWLLAVALYVLTMGSLHLRLFGVLPY